MILSEITGYIEVPFHGEKGESAYEIAVKYGYEGSEKEWVDSLGFIPDKSLGKEKFASEVTELLEEKISKGDLYNTNRVTVPATEASANLLNPSEAIKGVQISAASDGSWQKTNADTKSYVAIPVTTGHKYRLITKEGLHNNYTFYWASGSEADIDYLTYLSAVTGMYAHPTQEICAQAPEGANYLVYNNNLAEDMIYDYTEQGLLTEWVEYCAAQPEHEEKVYTIKEGLLPELGIAEIAEKSADTEAEVEKIKENLIAFNRLNGKKACFFGDSICYGNGYTGGYAKIIGENNNMTIQNLGVGSTMITDKVAASTIVTSVNGARVVWTTLSGNKFDPSLVDFSLTDDFGTVAYATRVWNSVHHQYDYTEVTEATWDGSTQLFMLRPSIADRVNYVDEDCDYIIGEGGYNDVIGAQWIGELTDEYDSELYTHSVLGGAELLCRRLLERFPGKKIGFILIHKALAYPYAAAANADGTQTYYFDELKKVFAKYSIPVLDLYNTSGLNTGLSAFLKYTRNNDGVHPNEEGYRKFYVPRIEAWMQTL